MKMIIFDKYIFLSENTLTSKIQKAGRPKTYSDRLIASFFKS
jgi:hypothetical protein